jgi:hypothetical protein
MGMNISSRHLLRVGVLGLAAVLALSACADDDTGGYAVIGDTDTGSTDDDGDGQPVEDGDGPAADEVTLDAAAQRWVAAFDSAVQGEADPDAPTGAWLTSVADHITTFVPPRTDPDIELSNIDISGTDATADACLMASAPSGDGGVATSGVWVAADLTFAPDDDGTWEVARVGGLDRYIGRDADVRRCATVDVGRQAVTAAVAAAEEWAAALGTGDRDTISELDGFANGPDEHELLARLMHDISNPDQLDYGGREPPEFADEARIDIDVEIRQVGQVGTSAADVEVCLAGTWGLFTPDGQRVIGAKEGESASSYAFGVASDEDGRFVVVASQPSTGGC